MTTPPPACPLHGDAARIYIGSTATCTACRDEITRALIAALEGDNMESHIVSNDAKG